MTDGATSYRWAYFHSKKNGAITGIHNLIRLAKTQYDRIIKGWRMDDGREYGPKKLPELAEALGMIVEVTTPYTPEQDGKAERSIRTIVERTRATMIDMDIPQHLWPEIMEAQIYITNRTATSALDGITPLEAVLKQIHGSGDFTPSLSHLRVLGCKAYVQIPPEKRTTSRKLDARADIGILVGYEGDHIYRIYMPHSKKVERSSNVRFDEDGYITDPSSELYDVPEISDTRGVTLNSDRQDTFQNAVKPSMNQDTQRSSDLEALLHPDAPLNRDSASEAEENVTPELSEDSDSDTEDLTIPPIQLLPVRGRPKGSKNKVHAPIPEYQRATRSKGQIDQSAAYAAFHSGESISDDPATIQEALARPDRDLWREAINREYTSLQKKKTWALHKRHLVPNGSRVLTGKLVLKSKRDKDGNILKRKARWVVRGFLQRYGEDYDQTYAGVCKNSSWKLAIALAVLFGLEIEQIDAITAFLNSDADEDIFVEPPPGWLENNKDVPKEEVYKLLKALYGLKQAPRLWQDYLRQKLGELDFEPCGSDSSVYFNKSTNILLITYVDDFLILRKNISDINAFKLALRKKFDIEDLRVANYFLGVRITRHKDRSISLY